MVVLSLTGVGACSGMACQAVSGGRRGREGSRGVGRGGRPGTGRLLPKL